MNWKLIRLVFKTILQVFDTLGYLFLSIIGILLIIGHFTGGNATVAVEMETAEWRDFILLMLGILMIRSYPDWPTKY